VTAAYLGLGSNLGDRHETLQRGIDLLAEHGVTTLASSSVWETDPVGGPEGQPAFLNAVIRVETDADPRALLEAARAAEAACGRVRTVRWGPRTLDVDVLLVDGYTSDDPDLTVPHPRIAERAFVVLPLLELDPDARLPDGTVLADLELSTDGARPFAPPLRAP
jgi:2-amino-4-hydroxy-6-hydroxymethyldihydropteridine diphosphokinase